MPASREQCFWAQNRIEAYIDDELLDSELELFDRHIETCEWCRKELSSAQLIAGELRALSPLRCPESVLERAAARTAVSSGGIGATRSENIRTRLGRFFTPAPAPVMAVLLLAIVAASFFILRHDRTPAVNTASTFAEVAVSAEEAAMVIDDVALAFSYVNKYSLRAVEVKQQGTILDRLMKSVYKTVIESMSPFPMK